MLLNKIPDAVEWLEGEVDNITTTREYLTPEEHSEAVRYLPASTTPYPGPFDLSLQLIVNLKVGGPIDVTYDYLSDAPDVFSLFSTGVIQMDLGGASLGLNSTDIIDSVIIRALDDPADDPRGTDEHFLINGFTIGDYTVVPEPATMGLLVFGGLALLRRKTK